MDRRYVLFESPVGVCGIAWNDSGICRIQLPEATPDKAARRLADSGARLARTAPVWVRDAMARIAEHLAGSPQSFEGIRLDWEGVPPFHRRVYEAALAVSSGTTATYGDLARRTGSPGAARAVGQAMAKNPFPIVVPCHRILAAGKGLGGFSADGGVTTKKRLLAIEGAPLAEETAPQPSLFEGARELTFDVDEALRAIAVAEPKLGVVIDRVPFALALAQTHSLFEALAEAIVYQQLTGKAARTIFGRVKGLFPRRRSLRPEDVLEAPDEALRSAGLSRNKALALKDLAAKSLDGTLPSFEALRAEADDAIVERLTVVRGIGRWTVQMLLIFRLGRPDVLPVDDYGVRKGLGVLLGRKQVPTARDVAQRGERWRPYRTVASWYLWRAAEGAGTGIT